MYRKTPTWMKILLVASALGISFNAHSENTPVRLSFGITPQKTASEVAKDWVPVLKYLADKTGYALEFETAKDIPTFEDRVGKGQYDIAYMNTYTYVVLHGVRAGYKAFAQEKERTLFGFIIVRRDSPYQSLEELKDKTLAFPSEAAFAASVVPRAHMTKLGIPFTPKYVGSHDSVYLSVVRGLYPAGGGAVRTLEAMPSDVREQLRVLWNTPHYAPYPFTAHQRVPKDVVEKLRQAMLYMEKDSEGAALLQRIAFKGISPTNDASYEEVRAVGRAISP